MDYVRIGTTYYKKISRCLASGERPEFIQKLLKYFSFHRKKLTVQQPLTNTQNQQEALEPKIKVIAAKPLTNPAIAAILTPEKYF